MSEKKLFVTMMGHSGESENLVAMSAKLCYSGADIRSLYEKTSGGDQSAFLQKLVDMGHFSPIEHASFTFGIEGVSRALLAQITRHRIASFSVQSQRYVKQTGSEGLAYMLPPRIKALGPEAETRFRNQMGTMAQWYDEWCEELGVEGKEDARFVLPNACETRMVMTMNARELHHMLALRCCERAQWEIRALAWAMRGHLERTAAKLFEGAGPACCSGACSEGSMSCGRPTEIRQRMSALKEFVAKYANDPQFPELMSDWATEAVG